MNQAILKRVEISDNGITKTALTELFELLLDPIFLRQAHQAHTEKNEAATDSDRDQANTALSLNDIDALWEMIVRNYDWDHNGPNQQTPDLISVGGAGSNNDHLVRQVGLEPTHPFGHRDLNPARLPIPPLAPVTS